MLIEYYALLLIEMFNLQQVSLTCFTCLYRHQENPYGLQL